MGGSLRVAVLGAPGVGKTAIIRQFLFGDYPERHQPTDGPCLYRPAVLLDGAVYDLSIRDGDGAGPGVAGPEGLELAGHGRLRAGLRHLQPRQLRLREGPAAANCGDQAGRRARGAHPRGRQQAGPAAAALWA